MGNCIYATIYSDFYHEVEQYRGPRGESDLHKPSSAPRRSTGERSARTLVLQRLWPYSPAKRLHPSRRLAQSLISARSYHLWEAFDINLKVGGTCGEIVTFKGKYCPTFVNSQVATLSYVCIS
ncbi:hypothetical protein EI94DRAFT_1107330 [Lactarius quietus]|nr:hypothetical protein EI94DRAFT_1107330 [Lactarius quietus]